MMERGKLILITGGARSGKSRLAEEMTRQLEASAGNGKVIYLATARVEDEEMRERILRHQQRRPVRWETIEEHSRVEAVISKQGGSASVILLDCLALLLSNWLQEFSCGCSIESISQQELQNNIEKPILERIAKLAETAFHTRSHVIAVTNEVGLGLVPDNPLGRIYRDLLGLSNQILAARADEVYVVWSGISLKLKGQGGG